MNWAEAGDELGQRVELLGVGQVVDAVGEYLGLLALGHAAYLLGHGAVGQQHEFLDQLVGVLRYLEINTDGFALLVYLELHFVAVEVRRSGVRAAAWPGGPAGALLPCSRLHPSR